MTIAPHDQSVIEGGMMTVSACLKVINTKFLINFFHIVSSSVFVVQNNKSLNDWSLGKQLT